MFKNYYFNEGQKYKVYCDMDGVIVNWIKGWNNISDVDFDTYKEEHGAKAAFELIADRGEDWWNDLEWLPDGKELWDYIKKYNPIILSTPIHTQESIDGKLKWIKRELGDNVPAIIEDNKWKYATPTSILIDDYPSRTSAFEEHGGIGVTHTDTKSTIEKLKELGL